MFETNNSFERISTSILAMDKQRNEVMNLAKFHLQRLCTFKITVFQSKILTILPQISNNIEKYQLSSNKKDLGKGQK